MINLLRLFLKKYTPKFYNRLQPIRNFIFKSFFTKKSQLNVLREFSEFSPNVSGDIDKKIGFSFLCNKMHDTKNLYKTANQLIDALYSKI